MAVAKKSKGKKTGPRPKTDLSPSARDHKAGRIRRDKQLALQTDDPEGLLVDAADVVSATEKLGKDFPSLALYLEAIKESLGGINILQWMAGQLTNNRVKITDKISIARALLTSLYHLKGVTEADLARLMPPDKNANSHFSSVKFEFTFGDGFGDVSQEEASADMDRDGEFTAPPPEKP